MQKEKTEVLNADSPLAQAINWDAIETPESSLTQETNTEKPSGEEVKTEAAVDGTQQSTPPKEEPSTPPVEQVDQEALRATLRQELESELRQTLSKEYETKSPKFANEYVAKLNELAELGVDINSNDFWSWQTRDLDKYDLSNKAHAIEVARLELEIENPDIPASKVERLLKRKYPALYDESIDPEDKEYREAVEDLEIDAIRSLKKLKEHKQKVTLPKTDLKQREEQAEAARKANEMFTLETRKTVNGYKEQPYKLTDDLEIKFQVSDEARKFAESAIVNNQTFFSDNYLNKDEKGNVSVDLPRLTRDMTRLAQFDDFIKAAYEQGVSVGKDQVVDMLENADEKTTARKQETFKSFEEQIAEQIAAQTTRRR